MKRGERRSRRWRLKTGERQLLLIAGDFVAASAATFTALALWAQFDWLGLGRGFVQARAGWFVLLPVAWLILMVNLYDVHRAASWRDTLRGVLWAAGVGLVLYLTVYFFRSEPGSLPRRGILYFLATAVALTLVWRFLYVRITVAPAFLRRALIVGAGESGCTMLKVIQSLNPAPLIVAGFIDDDVDKQGQTIGGAPVLGDSARLLQVAQEQEVSELIVAILGPMNGSMFQALLDAQERGVEIVRMPVAYEELLGRVPIQHLESDWLLRSFVDEVRASSLYLIAKRLMDLIGSLFGLFAFLTVLPSVSLAILLESGRPVFFPQIRLGQGGRPYRLVKFRTMRQDAEADGTARWADSDDPRMTRVGRVLRKMHLDEFPQFLNVLAGDMSLIGPRPERPEMVAELERQIPFYRARLLVKPGIGGWAQVNYGKGASLEGSAEKLEYDLYYIKHRGFWLDVILLFRSLGAMIGFRGI